MTNLQKFWHGKNVRSVYEPGRKCQWFCMIDIIAALRGVDYDSARNYWNVTKCRLAKKLNIHKFHQIKLLAKDGKWRYTDVMRYKDIVRLIQRLSGGTAKVFRKLIGAAAAGSAVVARVFGGLCGVPVRGVPCERAEMKVVNVRKVQGL